LAETNGATTFIIMTLSLKTVSLTVSSAIMLSVANKANYAAFFIVKLSVVMRNVIKLSVLC